jgi:Lrp/AsnC family leucine-responsive transcriptional regulator
MSQIDAIDERILTELQANGRLTMKALAERVGLSSPAMIERVRRLEERGIISGYRAVVKPSTLGRALSAFVFADVSAAANSAFLEAVEQEPGVVECHRLSGNPVYVCRTHVADPADLAELLDRLGATGARCHASVILQSPLEWRAIGGSDDQGSGANRVRRRRRSAETDLSDGVNGAAVRRPGRPRRRVVEIQ